MTEGNQPIPRTKHPVWTVYDRLRTARLNVKYYGSRVSILENWNMFFEAVVLVTAPSSAIAGWLVWKTAPGEILWKTLLATAAVAVVAKHLLNLPRKIKAYEIVLNGYRVLEYDLMQIKTLIEHNRSYDDALKREFRKALDREKALVGTTPEYKVDSRTLRRCEAEVKRELPHEEFFVPDH